MPGRDGNRSSSKEHMKNLINKGLIEVIQVSQRCTRIEPEALQRFKDSRKATRHRHNEVIELNTVSSKSVISELDRRLGKPAKRIGD